MDKFISNHFQKYFLGFYKNVPFPMGIALVDDFAGNYEDLLQDIELQDISKHWRVVSSKKIDIIME